MVRSTLRTAVSSSFKDHPSCIINLIGVTLSIWVVCHSKPGCYFFYLMKCYKNKGVAGRKVSLVHWIETANIRRLVMNWPTYPSSPQTKAWFSHRPGYTFLLISCCHGNSTFSSPFCLLMAWDGKFWMGLEQWEKKYMVVLLKVVTSFPQIIAHSLNSKKMF